MKEERPTFVGILVKREEGFKLPFDTQKAYTVVVRNETGEEESIEGWYLTPRDLQIEIGDRVKLVGHYEGWSRGDYIGAGKFAKENTNYPVWDEIIKVWDYCFECGKELMEDMIENKDWFDIRNCGESFPICKNCLDKSIKECTYKKGEYCTYGDNRNKQILCIKDECELEVE